MSSPPPQSQKIIITWGKKFDYFFFGHEHFFSKCTKYIWLESAGLDYLFFCIFQFQFISLFVFKFGIYIFSEKKHSLQSI